MNARDRSHEGIPRAPRNGPIPVAATQAGLLRWIESRRACATLNLTLVVTIEGPVDVPALERAIAHLVGRHEGLRTRFVSTSEGAFQHLDAAPPHPATMIDLRHLDRCAADAEVERIAQEDMQRVFDLATEHCARWTLLRVRDDLVMLVLTIHQIGCGAADLGNIIFPELTAIYDAYSMGQEPPLQEQTLHYADYSVWLRDWLAGVGAPTVAQWRSRFEGAQPIEIPTDGPRTSPASIEAETVSFLLPASLEEPIETLTRAGRIPAAAVILAAIAAAFAKRTGQTDMTVGLVADAHTVRPEAGTIVGRFLNPVPCRLDLTGDPTGRELLSRARKSVLEAYRNRIVPTEIALDCPSAMDSPLMRVMANVTSQLPGVGPAFRGTRTACTARQPEECRNELVFSVQRGRAGWDGYLRAAKATYSRATVARIVSDFVESATALVLTPDSKTLSLRETR